MLVATKTRTFLFIAAVLFTACSKKDTPNPPSVSGRYVPYKQEITPIYAFTRSKEINVKDIDLCVPLGFYHSRCADKILQSITIPLDSIRTTDGKSASIYINTSILQPRKYQYNMKQDEDRLYFRKILEKGEKIRKFSPKVPFLGELITSEVEAEKYATLSGKLSEAGFFLTSYSFCMRRDNQNYYGTENYLDLNYLRSELSDGDILLYVKKETHFKKTGN